MIPTGKVKGTINDDGSVGALVALMMEERWCSRKLLITMTNPDTQAWNEIERKLGGDYS